MFRLVIARICGPVRAVVWLWEGGTLWRAKWTRRGHKEPHPSITRVDKGGLHNTKLDVATRKLFLPSPSRRDARTAGCPQVSRPPPSPLLLHTWSHFVSRREKVADCSWCVSAQSWAQSGRGGIERHRETQAARRESERSGPLFLCLMRGALRGELAGMLRHASPQLSAALVAQCWDLIAKRRRLQVRVWLCPAAGVFLSFFLVVSLGDVATRKTKQMPVRSLRGKESLAHAAIKGTVGSLWS